MNSVIFLSIFKITHEEDEYNKSFDSKKTTNKK